MVVTSLHNFGCSGGGKLKQLGFVGHAIDLSTGAVSQTKTWFEVQGPESNETSFDSLHNLTDARATHVTAGLLIL